MGMSIDDARTELISGNPFTNKFAKALVVAIETMRKYQKIETIANEWKADHDNLDYVEDSYYWSKVIEVVEDGKID